MVLDDDIKGYGEGCPRSYVTGESSFGAAEFIHEIAAAVKASVRDFPSLRAWMDSNERLIDKNPAAWCALELAIIDALGKQCALGADSFLGEPCDPGVRFKYSAVIGSGDEAQLNRYLQAYSALGFDDFKLKLTGEQALDKRRINRFCELKPAARLRLDANNLWSESHQAADYLLQLPGVFFAIEEPLKARNYDGLERLGHLIPHKIILDESFTAMRDFKYLNLCRNKFIINLRVSKMGGLIRSKTISDMAWHLGLPYVIGAHVGETSILTRAAMLLGAAHSNILLAREGAAGEYLLTKDICKNPINFETGGYCRNPSARPGIGYEINPRQLSLHTPL